MLEALDERGVTPDLIVGKSAGALNGAFIASRLLSVETVHELGDSGVACGAERSFRSTR
jgi:predicted acylesterase/phospholipase RssA